MTELPAVFLSPVIPIWRKRISLAGLAHMRLWFVQFPFNKKKKTKTQYIQYAALQYEIFLLELQKQMI